MSSNYLYKYQKYKNKYFILNGGGIVYKLDQVYTLSQIEYNALTGIQTKNDDVIRVNTQALITGNAIQNDSIDKIKTIINNITHMRKNHNNIKVESPTGIELIELLKTLSVYTTTWEQLFNLIIAMIISNMLILVLDKNTEDETYILNEYKSFISHNITYIIKAYYKRMNASKCLIEGYLEIISPIIKLEEFIPNKDIIISFKSNARDLILACYRDSQECSSSDSLINYIQTLFKDDMQLQQLLSDNDFRQDIVHSKLAISGEYGMQVINIAYSENVCELTTFNGSKIAILINNENLPIQKLPNPLNEITCNFITTTFYVLSSFLYNSYDIYFPQNEKYIIDEIRFIFIKEGTLISILLNNGHETISSLNQLK